MYTVAYYPADPAAAGRSQPMRAAGNADEPESTGDRLRCFVATEAFL
jgi:hypothetical protein